MLYELLARMLLSFFVWILPFPLILTFHESSSRAWYMLQKWPFFTSEMPLHHSFMSETIILSAIETAALLKLVKKVYPWEW